MLNKKNIFTLYLLTSLALLNACDIKPSQTPKEVEPAKKSVLPPKNVDFTGTPHPSPKEPD